MRSRPCMRISCNPQPRGILVPAPGHGILMPELARYALLPPCSGYLYLGGIGTLEEYAPGLRRPSLPGVRDYPHPLPALDC